MKCEQCGEKINLRSGKSANFCPSCGNKVETQSSMSIFDNVESALRHIVENFGTDVLLGSRVIPLFNDLTHSQLKDEMVLIKMFSDSGVLECLKEAMLKPMSEQKLSIKRAKSKLPKFVQNSKDVDIMLHSYGAALGWQLPKPETAPSQPQSTSIRTSSGTEIAPKVGSIHIFSNINWRVLAIENKKALLISEEILEHRKYNVNVDKKGITWGDCMLRKYLNDEFYNSLGEAKSAIDLTRNMTPNNPWYGTLGGASTIDNIFVLSLDEVCRYFGDSTANLREKGSTGNEYFLNDSNDSTRVAYHGNKGDLWWLRSPGLNANCVAAVYDNGWIGVAGYGAQHDDGGVRPALWLNL